MLPSIFPKIIACTDTKAALTGTDDITRFFNFADADHNSQLPYATWQLLSGVFPTTVGVFPAPSEEFDIYNAHAEACRQWGKEQKALLQ